MRIAEVMKDYYINIEDIKAVYAFGSTGKARRAMHQAVQDMVEDAREKHAYFPIVTEKNEVRSIVELKNGQIIGTRYTASVFIAKYFKKEEIINEVVDDPTAPPKKRGRPRKYG